MAQQTGVMGAAGAHRRLWVSGQVDKQTIAEAEGSRHTVSTTEPSHQADTDPDCSGSSGSSGGVGSGSGSSRRGRTERVAAELQRPQRPLPALLLQVAQRRAELRRRIPPDRAAREVQRRQPQPSAQVVADASDAWLAQVGAAEVQ